MTNWVRFHTLKAEVRLRQDEHFTKEAVECIIEFEDFLRDLGHINTPFYGYLILFIARYFHSLVQSKKEKHSYEDEVRYKARSIEFFKRSLANSRASGCLQLFVPLTLCNICAGGMHNFTFRITNYYILF
jgi:hypothetical protein